jgi:hypothetical protein
MYHHLNHIFELNPHNRKSYMKIAEAMKNRLVRRSAGWARHIWESGIMTRRPIYR